MYGVTFVKAAFLWWNSMGIVWTQGLYFPYSELLVSYKGLSGGLEYGLKIPETGQLLGEPTNLSHLTRLEDLPSACIR